MMEFDASDQAGKRRFKKRYIPLVFLLLLFAALVVAWFQRTDIADNFIRSELDRRDVEARYRIEQIGFRRHAIRDLVIGDPERPDLTAERVEVGLKMTASGPGLGWIKASGVRLRGRLVDGQLSLGELDKFSDPADTRPFSLPDMLLTLVDGRMRLDTPYGAVGIAARGSGHLHNGFVGKVAAISRSLDIAGCGLSRPSFFGTLAIRDQRPALDGPLRMPRLICADSVVRGDDLAAQIDVTLGADLASVDGRVGLVGGPVSLAGNRAQEISTSLALSGDAANLAGEVDLALAGVRSDMGSARSIGFAGPFAYVGGTEGPRFTLSGVPELRGGAMPESLLSQVDDFADRFADSPAGPLSSRIGAALRRASGTLAGRSELTVRYASGNWLANVDGLTLRSASGARLTMTDRLLMRRGPQGFSAEGAPIFALSGGGLPELRLAVDGDSFRSGFSGTLRMADYRAGSASLGLPVLRFRRLGGGATGLDGSIRLSGPLPDGQIVDLRLPVEGRVAANGDYALFSRCTTATFRALRLSALRTGEQSFRLCPDGGPILSGDGAGVRFAFRADRETLSGRIGSTPLAIAAGMLRYSLAQGLKAGDVAVRLGEGPERTRLDMAGLTAIFGSTITGTVTGGEGKIANVPLLMEDIAGDWRFAEGGFAADAAMTVKDAEAVDRFLPLVTRDATIRFAGNDITATGMLVEPGTGRDISAVDIVHHLDSGTGRATLSVDNLRFDDRLQPEQLTPLTLGVVANVKGRISGKGLIEWNQTGVDSSGTFRTEGLDLAAAFGPVTGLSGEIAFTDLLGLETAAGQAANVATVNPGVQVRDGLVRYRILPDFRIQVEGGRWPFAGGELILRPTTLDFAESMERHLTFDVVGVRAADFLTVFDFDNLSATGTFDGQLPMVFDADGGRIVGGRLVSRQGGGTIAYVGELAQEDLSTFANFAFDMLRSLKYRSLEIGMNGDIDGEIITTVQFDGLQQGDDIEKNLITRELAKLPIQFNVRIEAPFMQLLQSVRGYYDPSVLVEQNLESLIRAQNAASRGKTGDEDAIQPSDSGDGL